MGTNGDKVTMEELAMKLVSLGEVMDNLKDEAAKATAVINAKLAESSAIYTKTQEMLLEQMKKKKVTEFKVGDYTAFAKSKTSTVVPPEALFEYFKKLKKSGDFYKYVSVRVTDAKKFIGEVVLKDFWEQETDHYAGVEVKRDKIVTPKIKS